MSKLIYKIMELKSLVIWMKVLLL